MVCSLLLLVWRAFCGLKSSVNMTASRQYLSPVHPSISDLRFRRRFVHNLSIAPPIKPGTADFSVGVD